MLLLYRAIVCLFAVVPSIAQSQGFEKITIRPARSADQSSMRLQVLANGDLKATSVPPVTLLSYAYDVPSNPSTRLSALPEWTVSERYDIEAVAPPMAAGAGENEGQSQIKRRLRQLLADRFGLVMRVENQRMPVYALTVSRSGAKLQKSAANGKDCVLDTDPQGCHFFVGGFGHPLNAKAVTMEDLAHYIENWTDLPVVNRTGLDGLFTLNSEGWLPMRLPPPPPGAGPDTNRFASLPSIFTVLGKLGLELHRQQDVLPVYTVHRIERPSFQLTLMISGLGWEQEVVRYDR